MEKKKNKCETAKEFLKQKFPKARSISVHTGEYGNVKYEVSNFENAYEYTSIKGEVLLNDNMTVKTHSRSVSASYCGSSEKDLALKTLKDAYEIELKALQSKFVNETIEVLNG